MAVEGLAGGDSNVEYEILLGVCDLVNVELDFVGEGDREVPDSNRPISCVVRPGGGKSPGSVDERLCLPAPEENKADLGLVVACETPETGRDSVPSVLSVIWLRRTLGSFEGGGYVDGVVGLNKDGSEAKDGEPV